MSTASTTAAPRVGVGAPVWGAKSWLGSVYPVGTAPKDFLPLYAQQFNSIELNTTHYRTPDEETIRRWRESTPEDFRFNVKFLQEVSHHRPLWAHADAVHRFIDRIRGLGDRLGVSFLQLPPTFTPGDLSDLKRFLASLPRDFDLAIEVRHPGFFHEHRLSAPLYELLASTGTHVVITDVAGRRDVPHLSLPTTKVLVRFIGNDLHPSDPSRMKEWVARIRTWLHLGLEQIEFFVHQPGDANAPELINAVVTELNEQCGLALRHWRKRDEGRQLGLF